MFYTFYNPQSNFYCSTFYLFDFLILVFTVNKKFKTYIDEYIIGESKLRNTFWCQYLLVSTNILLIVLHFSLLPPIFTALPTWNEA